jgi:hypothetical protein
MKWRLRDKVQVVQGVRGLDARRDDLDLSLSPSVQQVHELFPVKIVTAHCSKTEIANNNKKYLQVSGSLGEERRSSERAW